MSEHSNHDSRLTFDSLMGDPSGSIGAALRAAKAFLERTPTPGLLSALGRTIEEIPAARFPDKRWFQGSFGRGMADEPDDLLTGRGLFYLTEQRRLFLDCTAGHYQMTWGYEHPELRGALLDAVQRGVVWDNHSNMPAAPVKQLAAKLVQLANPGADLAAVQADPRRLNTVLLGVCTGTVACAAALKIMLIHYARTKAQEGPPVFVVLDGNYHGTDFLAQRLRGMWPDYLANIEVQTVQPNDGEELEQVVGRHGERVAGFWAEPIMMNREAIVVTPSYFRLARALCDQVGALMAIDEIQTGFWFPEVMYTRRCEVEPDFIVLGKGMTAGFHPLSALLYRSGLDYLEQYDAISTNGNAALAAYIGLACVALIEREAARIANLSAHLHGEMQALCAEFPHLLVGARGDGLMTGLKFHRVEDALGFQRCALDRGLWTRVHAYHPGHSTVLTKFALALEPEIADAAVNAARTLLAERRWA